jgi:hypothetical protein
MRKLVLSSLVALLPAVASASTLTGDDVYMQIPGFGNGMVTVGAGHDVMLGGTNFDLDAGPSGNMLHWNNREYESNFGVTSVVFGNMDFTDGSDLIGFLVSETQLTNLKVAVTASTLIFTFDANGVLEKGKKVIAGTYLTSGGIVSQQPPSPVPLPASAPLLLAAAGGLALLRRRKSRG